MDGSPPGCGGGRWKPPGGCAAECPRGAASRCATAAAGAAEVEPERSLTLASWGKLGKAAERFRDGRICRDAQGAVH